MIYSIDFFNEKGDEMKKMVSIVVPVYNGEKYIDRCMESLLKQTYNNINIIAVNDGSTDKSEEKLKEYINKDSRISIVNKPNGGLSSARNSGMKVAKGDYLMFVDVDDQIEPDTVATCVNKIEDADLLRFCMNEIDEEGHEKVYPALYNDYEDKILSNKTVFMDLLRGDIAAHSVLYLYRLDVLKKNHLQFDETVPYQEDYVFISNLLKYVSTVKIINNKFYKYYVVSDSLTHGIPNVIKNLKTLPLLKEKILNIIGDDVDREKYIILYNQSRIKLLVFYYSILTKNLAYNDFKKIIKDLNKVEKPIFQDINLDTVGKGGKIFVKLNLNNQIWLLYLYLCIFNKLGW